MAGTAAIARGTDNIILALREKLGDATFDSWLQTAAIETAEDTLAINTISRFNADFICRNYLTAIESVAGEFGYGVKIICAPTAAPVNDNVIQSKIAMPAARENTGVRFGDFLCAPENQFALSAAQKIASGAASFSPLFIYGPAGCGKSMIAAAIENEFDGRALHMTGAQFVSEFVRSIAARNNFAFKDFCRNCDLFILDDISALVGKKQTIDEFTTLLMDLVRAGKNVVITAENAPGQISGFDRRLQSLLASGLVADLTAPTVDIRRRMLVAGNVPGEIAAQIAGRIAANGHIVGGIVKKITTWRDLMGTPITAAVAESLISDCARKNRTPLAIARAMSEKTGISFDDICSGTRVASVVRARAMMMFALKQTGRQTLSEIGRIFGDRTHATVLHAIAMVEKMKSGDLIMSAELNEMCEMCR
ncbi:MAG: AAA family ATPase [Rickettsiales bacterium]|nr:AAA family ATPase [Rickettsiales bacterium]